jgi:hypothetical protein
VSWLKFFSARDSAIRRPNGPNRLVRKKPLKSLSRGETMQRLQQRNPAA